MSGLLHDRSGFAPVGPTDVPNVLDRRFAYAGVEKVHAGSLSVSACRLDERSLGAHDRVRIVIANEGVWGSTLMMPLWSPDGRRLAFTAARYHEVAEEWFNRVYVLGPDAGRLKNITPNLGSGQGAIAVDW